MTITTRDGWRFFYEDAGAGEPPIVFLHGLGHHEHYRAQVEYFARTHRVVAPDLPGFGASDDPDRQHTIAAFADDIAWLCEDVGLTRPVIVGHSMAGAVAVEVAAMYPTLPAAIVMIDPVPIVATPAFRQALGGLVATLGGPGYQSTLRGYARARMFRATDDDQLREQILNDIVAVPEHVAVLALSSVLSWNGAKAIRMVDVPMLLITAGDGPPADLQGLRELVPQLEIGRTVGSGHFAHVMVPDQINAMIERFVLVNVVEAGVKAAP